MEQGLAQELISLAPGCFPADEEGKPYFHFSCGDGWFQILRSLIAIIAHKSKRWSEVTEIRDRAEEKGDEIPEWIPNYFEKHPTDPWENFQFAQIKEKFGQLRVYVDACPDPEVFGAISMAEVLSGKTCEQCGHPGERRPGGWIKTLCDECHEN